MNYSNKKSLRKPDNVYSSYLNAFSFILISISLYYKCQLTLPSNLKLAGNKQFLSTLICLLTLVYNLITIICFFLNKINSNHNHNLNLNINHNLNHNNNNKDKLSVSSLYYFKNNFIHSICLIIQFLIFVIYWPLKLYNRDLLYYSSSNSKSFPDILSNQLSSLTSSASSSNVNNYDELNFLIELTIHILPYLLLLTDFLFFLPNYQIKKRLISLLIAVLIFFYYVFLLLLVDTGLNQNLPYPFLQSLIYSINHNNIKSIFLDVLIILVVCNLSFIVFIIHKKLHSLAVKNKINEKPITFLELI
ncbi:uncharacterized protein ASCRUDRAFT_7330 [Ascoidea rubescens DSM 1968]|uniref:Uncharacterized protein n=1 Tax=Ascoidea rubescens DSM 1968 TaxID=1344418 RepID=A0A1D2VK15_9ASCO|nr:hypothetical protein ASCRUDRAFT_7330 [Ascoidea rubescens DSM 1968]ODV61857.1 hypothetical protein ASCRUDRAFT_7330 [Ascoidea rubescens DSM 1968]